MELFSFILAFTNTPDSRYIYCLFSSRFRSFVRCYLKLRVECKAMTAVLTLASCLFLFISCSHTLKRWQQLYEFFIMAQCSKVGGKMKNGPNNEWIMRENVCVYAWPVNGISTFVCKFKYIMKSSHLWIRECAKKRKKASQHMRIYIYIRIYVRTRAVWLRPVAVRHGTRVLSFEYISSLESKWERKRVRMGK